MCSVMRYPGLYYLALGQIQIFDPKQYFFLLNLMQIDFHNNNSILVLFLLREILDSSRLELYSFEKLRKKFFDSFYS